MTPQLFHDAMDNRATSLSPTPPSGYDLKGVSLACSHQRLAERYRSDASRGMAIANFPRLLADYDRELLAEYLAQEAGLPPPNAGRMAAKVLKTAFGAPDAPRDWSDENLRQLGIGRATRPALLGLSPRPSLRIVDQVSSTDGTIRALLAAADDARVEAVLIPAQRETRRARTTLCISSQVGCARGCIFCESGRHGLERQLASSEMVDQFRLMRKLWSERSHGLITNVVFMGMGEPFDNMAAVCRAVRCLSDPCGFAFPPSHITVSTIGVAHQFESFFGTTRAELALSLHAPDDERRRRIMPTARRSDLVSLREALLAAVPPHRRVLVQYVLFAGFNDAPSDADALTTYLEPLHCRVNVIPANPGPDPRFVAPPPARVDAFVARLCEGEITTRLRRPRGCDVGGGCGQLAGAHRRAGGGVDHH